MPYDPRSVSAGGNRGLHDQFGSIPEKGNFRVIGVDTFDGTDWVQGDYETEEEARNVAKKEGGQMCKMYIYNKEGYYVVDYGQF